MARLEYRLAKLEAAQPEPQEDLSGLTAEEAYRRLLEDPMPKHPSGPAMSAEEAYRLLMEVDDEQTS